MPATVIVGAQWGDEGKGKVTDLLAADATAVCRFQGGNNAGHTVKVGDTTHKLHLLPSGILREGVLAGIGRGVVVDVPGLLGEVDGLGDLPRGDLLVDPACHVVLEHHRRLDAALDAKQGVGTTKRGIGPAYTTKKTRVGVRVSELLRDPARAIGRLHDAIEPWLTGIGGDVPDLDDTVKDAESWIPRLEPMVGDVAEATEARLDAGDHVLLEGAQGTLLDIDHGTYPYVTSSNTTAAGACTGIGLAPQRLTHVIGIVKAYTTRVGAGPFPTELDGAIADHLVEVGHERGTTTGRRRRVGWLDLPALAHAARVNGITHIGLTKADVLEDVDVKVCVAYEIDGSETTRYPVDTEALARAKPVLEDLGRLEKAKEGDAALEALIERVEATMNAPVALVGTGPARSESIQRGPLPPG